MSGNISGRLLSRRTMDLHAAVTSLGAVRPSVLPGLDGLLEQSVCAFGCTGQNADALANLKINVQQYYCNLVHIQLATDNYMYPSEIL